MRAKLDALLLLLVSVLAHGLALWALWPLFVEPAFGWARGPLWLVLGVALVFRTLCFREADAKALSTDAIIDACAVPTLCVVLGVGLYVVGRLGA